MDEQKPSTKVQRQLRKLAMLLRLQEIKARMSSSNPRADRPRQSRRSRRVDRQSRQRGDLQRQAPRRNSKNRLSERRSPSASRTSRIVIICRDPSRRSSTRSQALRSDDKPRNKADRSRLSRNEAPNPRFDLQSLLPRGRVTIRITITLISCRRGHDKRNTVTTDLSSDDKSSEGKDKVDNPKPMSIEKVVQHSPNRAPMESTPAQYDSPSSMSMWEALVQVASQRYEELLDEERRQKERQKQEAVTMVGGQCEADQQSDQSTSLIRSAEITIAENVTVGGDDEDEDPGRLVIDERAAEEPQARAEVIQVATVSNGIDEQQIQQQRETVIQPCNNSSLSNGVVGHNGAAVPDQGESPQVRHPVVVAVTTGVRPIRQPKHMSEVTFNRFMPYRIPMSYNKNMARKFPGAECRTPEQQAVRERNTIAARQSRAKMRMMDEMLQQEASNEKTHNHYMKERMAGIFTYANVLRDKIGLEEADFLEEFERVKHEYVPGPMRTHYVRNRPRSGQENGANGTSPTGLNGHVSSPGESEVTVNEKPDEIANGSETESAPEPEGTVLDLSIKSKRVKSFEDGVFY